LLLIIGGLLHSYFSGGL